MDNRSMLGSTPHYFKTGEKPTKITEGVRLCEEPDCETKLSRYNHNKRCSLHQAPKIKPWNPPRKKEYR